MKTLMVCYVQVPLYGRAVPHGGVRSLLYGSRGTAQGADQGGGATSNPVLGQSGVRGGRPRQMGCPRGI